jgi:hypothetical protein
VSSIASDIRIRPLSELDISRIVSIDERLTGVYRPEIWERRVGYYLRRDPESCPVAEFEGKLVGFMFSDIRGGEFRAQSTALPPRALPTLPAATSPPTARSATRLP